MDTVTRAELTPEQSQHQMRDTRLHINEQTHELVNKVAGTIGDAANAVDDVTRQVRDAVRVAAEGVRGAPALVLAHLHKALDVRRHPWWAIGGAVALGFMCARAWRSGR